MTTHEIITFDLKLAYHVSCSCGWHVTTCDATVAESAGRNHEHAPNRLDPYRHTPRVKPSP